VPNLWNLPMSFLWYLIFLLATVGLCCFIERKPVVV
jgi:hypothetical protein